MFELTRNTSRGSVTLLFERLDLAVVTAETAILLDKGNWQRCQLYGDITGWETEDGQPNCYKWRNPDATLDEITINPIHIHRNVQAAASHDAIAVKLLQDGGNTLRCMLRL